jgi:hypothetical protein
MRRGIKERKKGVLSKIKNRLLLIYASHTEPMEFLTALLAVGWGVWMLLPTESFLFFRQYWFLLVVAQEEIWGWMFVSVGLASLFSLIEGSVMRRRILMFCIFMFWLFLAAAFAITEPTLPITFFYSVMALATMWTFIRLKR